MLLQRSLTLCLITPLQYSCNFLDAVSAAATQLQNAHAAFPFIVSGAAAGAAAPGRCYAAAAVAASGTATVGITKRSSNAPGLMFLLQLLLLQRLLLLRLQLLLLNGTEVI